MTKKVTILLPTLNAATFLQETLESIEKTIIPEVTLLAWDNGSTDRTIELLKEWIPKRIPGEIIVDQPQAMLGSCLRKMVDLSSTEFIARIDGDDNCINNRFAKQLNFLQQHQSIGLVASSAQFINEHSQITDSFPRPSSPASILWSLFFRNPIVHPSVMMRRELVLEAGNYQEMGMGQDYDLWYRLLQITKAKSFDEPLVQYRLHSNSVGTNHKKNWPKLHLDLLRTYSKSIFPDVNPTHVEDVWNCLSPFGDKPNSSNRLGKIAWEMAISCVDNSVWRGEDILSTKEFYQSYCRCVPKSLSRYATQLALRSRNWRKLARY